MLEGKNFKDILLYELAIPLGALLLILILIGAGLWGYESYKANHEVNDVNNTERTTYVCHTQPEDCFPVNDFHESFLRSCYDAKLVGDDTPYHYCGEYYVIEGPEREDNEASEYEAPSESQGIGRAVESAPLTGKEVYNVYVGSHTRGIEAFDNPELLTYYNEYLQKQCPFYEPDGVTYRDCVLKVIEDLEQRITISTHEHAELEQYCATGAERSADNITLGYADLYNTCMAYKLLAEGKPEVLSKEEMQMLQRFAQSP